MCDHIYDFGTKLIEGRDYFAYHYYIPLFIKDKRIILRNFGSYLSISLFVLGIMRWDTGPVWIRII